jgi:valyl-tRNA synthetase
MTDASDLRSRTRFDPSEVEPRIVERWLDAGLHHPDPQGGPQENYSIAVPPPNVTGTLHMGHALNGTIQDVLIRTHRMRGQRTKWILGTDHAGIATQRQVEKRLEALGTSREAIGREAFVEAVWEWREEFGGQIIEQFKRLGAQLDYDDERFTMDERYVRAVQKVFVDLYEQGLIYRDTYMVNWDPGLRSAISDLEVEDREGVVDALHSIAYPLADGGGEVVVATVRPETMLADTAVAVHPGDERYRDLVGREVILPLVGRRLPIIADEYVKTDFGTGCLKITPGHDPNDFEIGRRHGLQEVSVIGEDGRMTAAAGERFAGLRVEEARAAVVGALEAEGRIRATEEYVHTVPYSQRSGERVEPLISLQWFMRMDELARPAAEAVRSGRIRIHPESQSRRYLDWLDEIRPWCISRQLWWGHQIPVWYRGEERHVGAEPPEGEGWERDPDVLDTWFSSGLWPFATLGWPQDTPELRAFYPTDVLSTARDILFLWVARMVMLGLRFTGEIPFSDVYIHSVIQAPDGRRMSKSLGTGVDPLDLIDGGPRPEAFPQGGDFPAYGADAVRFGLLAMSSSQDVRFSEEKIAQGQALVNKLFNATRFALLQVGEEDVPAQAPTGGGAVVEDRWILSRLEAAKAAMRERVDGFDFAKAALGLYDYVYGELCDWYLEMVKPRLYAEDDPEGRAALAATLRHVLRETLLLAHPIIPFVTEELWGMLGEEGLLAEAQASPPDPSARDAAAEDEVGRAIAAVTALRGWRDRCEVRPGAVVPVRLAAAGYENVAGTITSLARVALDGDDGAEPVAGVAIPGGSVDILASPEVDVEAAERRLEARRAELRAEIERAERKLANQGFVAKAPAAVVDAERAKLARHRDELEGLA